MGDDDKWVAKKYWLKDLKEGVWKGECLDVKGDLVFRVNVIATVVQKFTSEDGQYVFVVLDDASDTMRVKAWRRDVNKFRDIREGDLVNLFASVQEYDGEVYLSPIIVKKLDNPNWELLRVIELNKKKKPEKKEKVNIISLIKKLDTGLGAGFDDLLKVSGLPKEELVSELRKLMSDGDVYEPEPKRLKVLE